MAAHVEQTSSPLDKLRASQVRRPRAFELRLPPPPPSPKQGAGGAAPAGGTGGVPLFLKTLEGGPGGTTAQAKPIPPLKDGAGQTKNPPAGHADSCPNTPLQNTNEVCYSAPMKWATGPLLFLGACRIRMYWGLTTEHPPVAGALREQPKGQDPPRMAGTGANAVVRHRLIEAAQLRNGS